MGVVLEKCVVLKIFVHASVLLAPFLCKSDHAFYQSYNYDSLCS